MTEEQKATATVRVVSSNPAEVNTERELTNHLRMANSLHRSLDVTEVLRLFAMELRREANISSLHYTNPKRALDLQFGEPTLHSLEYQLDGNGENYGKVRLTRAQRLNRREIEQIELALSALVPALRNALQYLQAMQTAARDALTGVGNRTALEITAEREIALARRNMQPSALLVIDIDHFKRVNDEYGHHAGDAVLIETTRQLKLNCRDSDSIFRFGGEEFVVLLSQTDEIGALAIAERIRHAIDAMRVPYEGHSIRVTASIGVARLNPGEGFPGWFDRADRALYLAKQAGRNRVIRAAQRNIA